MNPDFLQIKEESAEEFLNIAKQLFNNYAIQNHETLYRITEIEFYWHSQSHKDESTYKRNHVNPATGEWFFHYSGVDIALKNEETNGHGGILIRGIMDTATREKTIGPMICAMKLFSGTNAFSKSIETRIVKHSFSPLEPKQTERIGLGEKAIKNGSDKLKYRFVIAI